MEIFLVFLIPIAIAIFAFIFSKGISFKEFMIHIAVQVLVCLAFIGTLYFNGMTFTETWNGKVVKKYSEKVSCSHSYECNCRTDSKGNRHCSTCYEHPWDVDWNVEDNTGYEWEIERIDRRGLREPERFSKVQIGEATAHPHSYKNYLKASKTSVYKEKYKTTFKPEDLPEYPNHFFDYYKLDRLIDMAGVSTQQSHWDFIQMNGEFGKKECNAILVLTKNQPIEFAEALYTYWGGGNKNDSILIINVDDAKKINWVEVYALTENSIFQVKLKSDITALKEFNIDKVLEVYSYNIMSNFQRMEMKNFEYLKYNLQPNMVAVIILLIIGCGLSIGLAIFFHNDESFD